MLVRSEKAGKSRTVSVEVVELAAAILAFCACHTFPHVDSHF